VFVLASGVDHFLLGSRIVGKHEPLQKTKCKKVQLSGKYIRIRKVMQ
jgi:hypothetical protein